MDDILIHSKDTESHLTHVKEVLTSFQQYKL